MVRNYQRLRKYVDGIITRDRFRDNYVNVEGKNDFETDTSVVVGIKWVNELEQSKVTAIVRWNNIVQYVWFLHYLKSPW